MKLTDYRRRRQWVVLVFLSAVCLTTGVANSKIISVRPDGKGHYPTIQAAINAAEPGDEVVLRRGIYTGDGNFNLNFHGKAITVRSRRPKSNICIRRTIIDADGQGVIVRFINDEGPGTVFEGFTLGAGDTSKDLRGDPGFFEFSIKARPTTRRLRNKPTDTPRLARSTEFQLSDWICGGIPASGRLWNGHDTFLQPVNTTNYYGSGDVDLDGEITTDDLTEMQQIINGSLPQNIRADLNGDSFINSSDITLLNQALSGGILPAWWNQLTTRQQRNTWVDKIMELDKTDEHIYTYSFFVCHHFAYQTTIHGSFERDDLAAESTEYDGGQTVYNLPLHRADISSPTNHAINAILVGDDPLNFDDWHFIEPQNDTDVIPGDWNMRYGSTVWIGNRFNQMGDMVTYYVDLSGWTLESYSPDLILTRSVPPVVEYDNHKDLWHPVIIPNPSSGLLFFEKMREDMTRTTDIHVTNVSAADFDNAVPLTNRFHFSRILDITTASDGSIHVLFESKSGGDLQNLFHGIYDPLGQTITDISQVAPGLRLPAMARIEVTPAGEILVFWSEISGFSGMYEMGIHWTKSSGVGWDSPQLLTPDIMQKQTGDWLNRQFAWYEFDTELMDDGRIILAYIERYETFNLYLSHFIYDGTWTHTQIENTGWNNSAQGLDLCVSGDGTIHMAYWRANEPQGCYEVGTEPKEGRGDIYHRSFDGVSWSGPVIVDNSGLASCSRIAQGAGGSAYMTWERRVGDNVVPVYAKYADGAWQSSKELTVRPEANAWYPIIGKLHDDNVLVAWSSRSDDLVTIEMQVVEPAPPDAQSNTVVSPLGAPVTIYLEADDDGLPEPPGALTYIITSLPGHGTLDDPQAGTIITVPYIIANYDNQLEYTPDTGYVGQDSFAFKANDGGTAPYGGNSNTAAINIEIANCLDITIGTGTSTWSYPMYTFYHDSRTQVIYLSDEIGTAGTITNLALDVTTIPGQTMNDWTIRMNHTTMSTYTTPSLEATGWTVVYQSHETIDSTGSQWFEFSMPFDYNGTDNLLVDFGHNNDSYTTYGQCRYSTPGGTRSAYAYSDSGYGNPLDWSGTSLPTVSGIDKVPNIRLTICSDVSEPISANVILDRQWMYQNLSGQNRSRLTADTSVIDDPLSNSSYSYTWEFILPGDVTLEPTIIGPNDANSLTFASRGCDEPTGISDLGETFQVKVTVTGNDHSNTGSAQMDFGIALLGDVNNDTAVNVADRGITNAFWRTGSAGSFTLADCDVNCDGVVNVADRGITNAIWRGLLGSNSITNYCPLR